MVWLFGWNLEHITICSNFVGQRDRRNYQKSFPSMKEDAIKSALLDIEDAIRGAPFESWRKDFVRRNLGQFSFEDENKLIYTDIHKEFEDGVEKRILEALPAGFDYDDFQRSLPGYIDGPGKDDEATGKAITMLIEVGDFEQFKTMMMFYRREKEEEESKHSGDQLTGLVTNSKDVAQIGDVDGMMDMVRTIKYRHETCFCLLLLNQSHPLSQNTTFLPFFDLYPLQCGQLACAADNEGWTNCLTIDWMTIDKKAVEPEKRKTKNDIYLRGVWTMNMVRLHITHITPLRCSLRVSVPECCLPSPPPPSQPEPIQISYH